MRIIKKNYTIYTTGFYLLIIGLFVHCANPVPPSGGDRDTTPPKLILEKSTPNLQTNFTKQPIELTFDEWVTVKDITKNVLVSPPLEKGRLEVSLKKRTVVVKFPDDEILKPDATYVINFGEAIGDLNENNKAEDLRFIFSTGDKIDSLEVKGKVIDAFSGEPVAETVVMLYRNLADSVVYTQRPFYFSKTDEEGKFTVGNLKAGEYKIAATQDKINEDYKFSPGEQIAFIPENIIVSDSLTTSVNLRLFLPVPNFQLAKTLDKTYGRVGLQFNQPPENVELNYSPANLTAFTEVEKDTLRVWYDLPDSTRWEIFINNNKVPFDTANVKVYSRNTFINKANLRTVNRPSLTPKNINPTKPLRIAFNHPLVELDTSLIVLSKDSTQSKLSADYQLDSATAQRELIINYKWQDSISYQLQILPNALTDIYGLQNDTIRQNYQALTKADFGIIDFTISDLDSTQQYVLRLFFKKTNLVETYLINDVKEWKKSIPSLPAGEYNIEWIEDKNRNGKWDTGNYTEQRQPEIIKFKTLEALRANWNLNATFTPTEL